MRLASVAAIAVLLGILPSIGVSADPPRLAVVDFTVSSDNPRLKYVGKGFAELIAAQLATSRDIRLIERERREALLGELEFSLSDMADAETRVKIGRLLAADYLVCGEIIDMDSAVLLSCRLVQVETGEVLWTDQNLGSLTDYDGISRRIAASALKKLGAGKAAAAVAAAVTPVEAATGAAAEQKAEAVLAFSRAVDALDRKDRAEAKRQIEVARAIDPANRAVARYAAKLQSGSPRFQVELESCAPGYNPALLGLIDKASAYTWKSNSRLTGSDLGEYEIVTIPTPNDDLVHKEQGSASVTGIMVPLGRRFGIMAEYGTANSNGYAGIEGGAGYPFAHGSDESQINLDQRYRSGALGLGCRVAPTLAVGAALRLAGLEEKTEESVATWMDFYPEEVGLSYSLAAGAAYRGPGGRLSADLETVWSTQPDFYVLSPEGGIGAGSPGNFVRGDKPLLVTLGVTGALLEGTLFANLRLIGNIGLDDRGYFSSRLIPGLEWWPLRWIGLRAAYEHSFVTAKQGAVDGGGGSASGSGFMGGLTLSLWGFDLNLNYINRYRPYSLLPGLGHQDRTFLMGLSWSGLLERS